jgi:hypothetical protein
VVLANLASESETCVGSRGHLVGASISFEKNFCRLPFTPPALVRRIGPSGQKFSHDSIQTSPDESKLKLDVILASLSINVILLCLYL